jgi:ubiquitin-protein ligase E3 C
MSICTEFGIAQTVDLKPNGSSIPVTRDNKLEYIHRVSHYRLTKQIKRQSDAFFQGLSSMIDPKWLRYVQHIRRCFSSDSVNRMFNQQELQLLLGGVNTPVDVSDLRRNTVYGGSFDDNEPTIVAFWKVRMRPFFPASAPFLTKTSFCRLSRVSMLSNAKRCCDLSRVSGGLLFCACLRIPCFRTQCASSRGFGGLNPKLSIRSAGEDQTRLPTASTCVNLLKVQFLF